MKWLETQKIQNLLIATKEVFRQIEPDEQTLNYNLAYWVKKGQLISLKKGSYVFTRTWEKTIDKTRYLEYLANQIYIPSYVSFEYVMQKYGLLTESVYGLTCASTNKTRTFINNFGRFTYYSISPKLFTGFQITNTPPAPIYIAIKPKAVFDFLYVRFFRSALINTTAIKELRINWENVSKSEYNQIKKYTEISGSQKVRQAVSIIYDIYYS